jgi:hypothetical protein
MSVQKYPGRVLSKTPPTITPPVDGEGGSAPGVWTLSEALENEKAGTWPKPVLPGSCIVGEMEATATRT